MIVTNPFAAEGRWFKGNLHTHTTESDGWLGHAAMVARYREAGYDFLAITDHGKVTPVEGLGGDGFLVLPGEEVDAGRFEAVAINLREAVTPKGLRAPREILEEIRRQGGIGYLAHPRAYDALLSERVWKEKGVFSRVFALEIYNTSVEHAFGKGDSTAMWDIALDRGAKVHGVASDDAHGHHHERRPMDIAQAFVMVRAKELSAEGVVDALAGGRFFSSTGLRIEDVRVGATEITVECAQARTITTITNGVRGERRTLLEKPISPARFDIDPKTRYLRVECADAVGRRAWTNVLLAREER